MANIDYKQTNIIVNQDTYDNLNLNANIQVGETDVSTTNPVPVTTGGDAVETTFTRPNNTTLYSANDVVGTDTATNMEFENVVPINASTCIIAGAYLRIKMASFPSGMTSFRLHLYNSTPTAITDNLAYNIIDADRSKYLGYITFPNPEDLGDNILWSQVENINMIRKLDASSKSIFAVLQTVGSWTPVAQTVFEIGLCVLGR